MKKKIIICTAGLFFTFCSLSANAQEGFLAEVRLFAGNFAPRGWAFCHGQLLAISQYSAVFSLVGTTYGGDGRTTFALPDLRGRVPVGVGNGPGLSNQRLGSKSGSEKTTLTVAQLPAHTHNLMANKNGAGTDNKNKTGSHLISSQSETIPTSTTGGSQSVNIMQPSLGLNYIICLQGVFPSRS